MKGLLIEAAKYRLQDYRSDPETEPLAMAVVNMATAFAHTPCARFDQEAHETLEFEEFPTWNYSALRLPKWARVVGLIEETFNLLGVDGPNFEGIEPEGTLFDKDNITGIKMTREGDSIAGTVYFEEPGCYRGAVDFVVRRKWFAGWRVEEFILPVMGLHLDRINGTSWRARKPFGADGFLQPHRRIDRKNPATVRISNVDSLKVEVDGKQELVYPQTMQRYLTGKAVFVLVDGDVSAGQVFEVLGKLRSSVDPRTLFYVASESHQSADTMRNDSAPILMTSGAPFRRGQIGGAVVGSVCFTEGTIHASPGERVVSRVDNFEDIFRFIRNSKNRYPRQYFLAADPNVPALLLATTLDRLAEDKPQRVVVMVGSVYRGVLFELMEGNTEE